MTTKTAQPSLDWLNFKDNLFRMSDHRINVIDTQLRTSIGQIRSMANVHDISRTGFD